MKIYRGLFCNYPMSTPTKVIVREAKDALLIEYSDGQEYTLPAEFLRVYSPSAEVRGHGTGNETLQFGKRNVTLREKFAAGVLVGLILLVGILPFPFVKVIESGVEPILLQIVGAG